MLRALAVCRKSFSSSVAAEWQAWQALFTSAVLLFFSYYAPAPKVGAFSDDARLTSE